MPDPTPHLRLRSQQLVDSRCATPAKVVTALGAVQAQDTGSAIEALGCRIPGSRAVEIEKAIAAGTIVRTWPMRGTLHFVPAPDIRWMLALLAPRVAASCGARLRQLELDDATFARAARTLEKALADGPVTREALLLTMENAGISTAGGRGYHIFFRLSLLGLLCCGPREGKQPTFALLDQWVPPGKPLTREESLATLARRYFTGHGPAGIADFVWWSGLKVTEAKEAVGLVAGELAGMSIAGVEHWHAAEWSAAPHRGAHLLPAFDEFLLGYKDRRAVLDPAHANNVVPGGNGVFLPIMVCDGRVTGTWKRSPGKSGPGVTLQPFAPLTKSQGQAFAAAAVRFTAFHRAS